MPSRRASPDVIEPPPEDRDAMTPVDLVAERVHSTAIHLLRRLRKGDVKSGLTGPRLSALSVLVFGGPMTLGELAAAEQVRPPTMTRLVRALEGQGLVAREPVAGDRRQVRLRATAAGRAVLDRGRRRRVGALAAALRSLSESEHAALATGTEVLERVVRALGEEDRRAR